MLDDNMKDMLNDLMELYDLAYQQLKKQVAYIISNNIKDRRFIESTFEELINIPTDKCYKLFLKLYDYVKAFDEVMANDYYAMYEELYNAEESKKKSH